MSFCPSDNRKFVYINCIPTVSIQLFIEKVQSLTNSNNYLNMDNTDSVDVVAIDSDDTEADNNIFAKPIIQLFKRLITNDSKQSTVLTNAQIVDILMKEFSINLWEIHELEGEIYLTIMKKYLKDWPQWDEFDKTINKLKNKNDAAAVDKMLESNYYNLKEYLNVMLNRSQALAKPTVKKVMEETATKENSNKEAQNDTVVLQVQASRNQLNQLFFRRPNPELNDTVFNCEFTVPTQIKVNTMPLEAILNWWSIKIGIAKGTNYFYERKTVHHLQHILVNKNLKTKYNLLKTLPQDIQVNSVPKTEKRVSVAMSQYISTIDKINSDFDCAYKEVYEFIKKDMKLFPSTVFARASHRRYTNKYPYIRYLYKEVGNPDISLRKYDLQLEETVSPMYRVYLGYAQFTSNVTLTIECVTCSRDFTGPSMVEELKAHFEEYHQNEPDWKCTNCNKTFSMVFLAQNWWTHRC